MLFFVALLAFASPAAAQRVIPLRVHVDGTRAATSFRVRRGDRVICEHAIDPELDAPRCLAETALPGPGTYTVEIDVLPGRTEVRSYRYRLPIPRDAIAATLELDLAYAYSPDTAWLGTAWLDVERPGPAEGARIDDTGRHLVVDRPVLWPYGFVEVLDSPRPPGPRFWCAMGPSLGQIVVVLPGAPAWLAGSGDHLLLGEPPGIVRLRTHVHLLRARGTEAVEPSARPILRRTDRRFVERTFEIPASGAPR